MSTNMESTHRLKALFEDWKCEHQALDRHVDDLLEWLADGSCPEDIRCEEASDRLQQLRDRLQRQFDLENGISGLLVKARGSQTQELHAVLDKAEREHQQLMNRLNDLIDRSGNACAGFPSWQEAVYQINLFIDVLEQHEDEEAERVGWLIPREGEKEIT